MTLRSVLRPVWQCQPAKRVPPEDAKPDAERQAVQLRMGQTATVLYPDAAFLRTKAVQSAYLDAFEPVTTRLLVTPNTPGTLFAWIPAMFLSASESTVPSSVTRP
jgi:hypothetical protein